MTLAAAPVQTSGSARWERVARPLLVGSGFAAATVALHFRDPHEKGSWGLCPFAAVGIHCPGCGGLRAVNDLTDLRFADAASSNLLFIVLAPFLVAAFARWTVGRWTGEPWQPSPRTVKVALPVLVVAMLVFTVLRNTSAGSWLAP
ncbi:MAG TPA: DUF2752 domain-containing protein [Nocardioides sp.]|nr:DUF2752 domain-containing protein [Nocardioides sp.]